MCGRFALALKRKALEALLGAPLEGPFEARYNIAPASPVLAFGRSDGPAGFLHARWGLWPSWVRDPANFTQIINARIETVLEKPSFRSAVRHRRWLVPASGFFEWKRDQKPPQPWFASPASGEPVALAALGETWTGPDGECVDTLALMTQPAVGALAEIHHRQPVAVRPEDFAAWLDTGSVPAEKALDLLSQPDPLFWQAHPVSRAVNGAGNDHPGLTEAVEDDAALPPPVSQLSLF